VGFGWRSGAGSFRASPVLARLEVVAVEQTLTLRFPLGAGVRPERRSAALQAVRTRAAARQGGARRKARLHAARGDPRPE